MAAISVRINKLSAKAASGASNHADRSGRIPSYVDTTRTPDNILWRSPGMPPIPRLFGIIKGRHKQATGRSWRQDSPPFVDGIITFSSDAKLTDLAAHDRAAKDYLAKVIKQHNLRADALIYLTRHADESRPHYHFLLANQHKNGRPAGQSFDRKALIKLQDLAGETFGHLDLQRGKSKFERIADGDPKSAYINRSVRQLHTDLPADLAKAEAKIAKNERLVANTEAKILAGKGDLSRLSKRLATYDSRLTKAKSAGGILAGLVAGLTGHETKKAKAGRDKSDQAAAMARADLQAQSRDLGAALRRADHLAAAVAAHPDEIARAAAKATADQKSDIYALQMELRLHIGILDRVAPDWRSRNRPSAGPRQ